MRSIFGWSYPPGAANDPRAPYNQTDEGPCDVCGQSLDECICPECPTCGGVGDPACYDGSVRCSWCGVRPAGDHRTPETCPGCRACHLFSIERTLTDLPPHGLVRSLGQVVLRAQAEERWERWGEEEAKWDAYAKELDELDRGWDAYAKELDRGDR